MAEKYAPCPDCPCQVVPDAMILHVLYVHAKDLGIYTVKAADEYLKAKKGGK